jgi:polyphosphate glucokinase
MLTATPSRAARVRAPTPKLGAGPRTLCIDIGGTGLKALLVDGKGAPTTERVRVDTPKPASPHAVLRAIWALIEPLGVFERVSVGFPGVVIEGVIKTAPNLDPKWNDFPLAKSIADSTRRPVRVLNDAGVQGYGVIEGRGVEILLTLGTGMGCALFVDGHYVPNLELAHHPLHKGKTYEDLVGEPAYLRLGKKKWNKHVARVIETVLPTFNPRRMYLGGGNAKHVTLDLPSNVRLTPNVAGLTGGFELWQHDDETILAHAPAGLEDVENTIKESGGKGAKRGSSAPTT